jgi:hypothetical protein
VEGSEALVGWEAAVRVLVVEDDVDRVEESARRVGLGKQSVERKR